MTKDARPTGMAGFITVWIGQIVSLVGTNMTALGLPIWAFAQTGRATDLTLMWFFYTIGYTVMSPIAGVFVDRSNRKFMMMISDLASGMTTVAILILHSMGHLEIWHLFVTSTIQGIFQSFQFPAFSVAVTLMVPKEHYIRANSLMEVAGDGARIIAPMLAGALLGALGDVRGLQAILLIDIVSFIVAIVTLLFVHVPQPEPSAEARAGQENMLQEVIVGFRYILERPSLSGLLLIFMIGNFLETISYSLWSPMVLARSGNNEWLFATLQSVGAIGRVLGGAAIAAWGGFKRRVHGLLLGWSLTTVLWTILFGLGRPEPVWPGLVIWFVAAFAGSLVGSLPNSSSQAIWQSKVPPDMQGRVFSVRAAIAFAVTPLSTLLAGPLADQVMEPGMQEGGALAGMFGWLVGTGPGAGMALIHVLIGLSSLFLVGIAYLIPAIRNVEDILPDHEIAADGERAASSAAH